MASNELTHDADKNNDSSKSMNDPKTDTFQVVAGGDVTTSSKHGNPNYVLRLRGSYTGAVWATYKGANACATVTSDPLTNGHFAMGKDYTISQNANNMTFIITTTAPGNGYHGDTTTGTLVVGSGGNGGGNGDGNDDGDGHHE